MTDQNSAAPQDEALDANAAAAQDEGSFDDYFNEFSGSKPADSAEEERDQGEDKPTDDTAGQDDAEAGEGETGSDGQAGDTSGEDLTPREKELQAQLARLQQSEASQRGRVGALQRQINDFKRKQGQAESQPQQPSTTPGKPSEEDAQKQAMADAVGSDDWESLKQDFPDIARALEARLDADRQERTRLQQEVAELRSTVQPIQQQAHEQYLGSQQRALEARHADWQEVVNAPAFQQWLQQQPPSIQALTESDDAAEAAALLDLYKGTNQATGSDAAQADAQRAKRQQRLEGAVTPQRRGAAKRDAVPDDWEGQFNHFAKHQR